MKRVLFAIKSNYEDAAYEKILLAYKSMYNEEYYYDKEYYLHGTLKALKENTYDILVINENLETAPIDAEIIDKITDTYPNLRIIMAINNSHMEDAFTSQLYSIGVYDCLYSNEFNVENLIKLIRNGRNKKEAKEYYNIDDGVEELKSKFKLKEITSKEIDNIQLAFKNSENEQ